MPNRHFQANQHLHTIFSLTLLPFCQLRWNEAHIYSFHHHFASVQNELYSGDPPEWWPNAPFKRQTLDSGRKRADELMQSLQAYFQVADPYIVPASTPV